MPQQKSIKDFQSELFEIHRRQANIFSELIQEILSLNKALLEKNSEVEKEIKQTP